MIDETTGHDPRLMLAWWGGVHFGGAGPLAAVGAWRGAG